MSVYLSAVTDDQAQQVQEAHGNDGEGWCVFHLRHYSIRVRYGECDAFVRAARARAAYRRQSRPPARPPTPPVPSADGWAGVVWRRPEGL
jgi:hypothetical protein